MIIAIDGPSGAGKSTVAKLLSKRLNFEYVDTGAMYRAFGLKFYRNNLEITKENIDKIIGNTSISYKANNVYLDGENVEGLIRNDNISRYASEISKFQEVRDIMVNIQRNISKVSNIVMDGRDIATVVFPNADYKFFITASVEIRAERRFTELIQKDNSITYEQVVNDIKNRDNNDTTRKNSPLRIAEGATVIDTSDMTIDEVVEKLADMIKEN